MADDGPGARAPAGSSRGFIKPACIVAKGFEAVAPVDQTLTLIEQSFEFDGFDLRAVLHGLALPLRLFVAVEVAFDPVDLAVEEVHDGPEQIGKILVELRVRRHCAESVEDGGELRFGHSRFRQGPWISLVLAGAVSGQRQLVQRRAVGEAA
jgi:hypothetical protein